MSSSFIASRTYLPSKNEISRSNNFFAYTSNALWNDISEHE